MIDEPWIALLGDPMEGYTVFGPCDKQRAYSIDDSWVFPLEKPPAGDDAGYDPKGMIVVFDGNIGRGFERGGCRKGSGGGHREEGAAGDIGSAHPRNAPYQAFDASDAEIVVAAGNDELWREVCEATGKEELLSDPRFAGISQRAKNQAALAAILQEVLSTRTAREWLDELERRGVPCGRMNTFADVLGDPELASTGLIQEMPVPVAGTTKTIAYPVQLDGNRVRASLPPPRLGEHSDDVYAEWTGKASPATVVRGE